MTSFCVEACIICDIDGFTGRHESTIVGEAPPGFAGECTFIAHNMQWIAFIAGSVDLEVKMSVSNCRDGTGLEFGLYKGINCANFQRISNCFGGAAGIVGPGGSGVIKNNEPLVIGQYYYIVMDGGLGDNCDWTFEVVSGDTRVAPLETSGSIAGTLLTCPDLETVYTVEPPLGATEFEWKLDGRNLNVNNDTVAITFLEDGSHQLCVTSSNACDEAPPSCQTIVVRSIPITFLSEKICEDEVFETAGQRVEQSGLYEFPLLSEDGCDSLVVLDLEVVSVPVLDLDLNICEDDSLYIGGNPYYQSGSYQERLLTDLGCDSVVNLELFVVLCQIQASEAVNSVICHGERSGSITFQVERGTPPFTYNWAKIDDATIAGNGEVNDLNVLQFIDNLPQGTYLINIFDDFGNTSILIADILEPPPISASFEVVDRNGFDVTCFGGGDGELTVLASGGVGDYGYHWEGGARTNQLTNLAADTYRVTISDEVNCERVFEYALTAPAPIVFEIMAFDPTCDGPNTGRVIFENVSGGAAGYTYQITGFPPAGQNVFTQLGAGAYEVTLMDKNGCTVRESFALTAAEIPEIQAIDDLEINLGDSLLMEVITNNVTLDAVAWDTLYGLSCADCLQPYLNPYYATDYTVSVTSIDGCTDSESFSVRVNKFRRVNAPNVFSPNFDGINDRFSVFGGPEVIQIANLSVYDRWGGLVFQQKEVDHRSAFDGWDGTFQGQQVGEGVYLWTAEVLFIDGFRGVYSGDVAIIR